MGVGRSAKDGTWKGWSFDTELIVPFNDDNLVCRQECIISDHYSLNASNSGKNATPIFLPTVEFS